MAGPTRQLRRIDAHRCERSPTGGHRWVRCDPSGRALSALAVWPASALIAWYCRDCGRSEDGR